MSCTIVLPTLMDSVHVFLPSHDDRERSIPKPMFVSER